MPLYGHVAAIGFLDTLQIANGVKPTLSPPGTLGEAETEAENDLDEEPESNIGSDPLRTPSPNGFPSPVVQMEEARKTWHFPPEEPDFQEEAIREVKRYMAHPPPPKTDADFPLLPPGLPANAYAYDDDEKALDGPLEPKDFKDLELDLPPGVPQHASDAHGGPAMQLPASKADKGTIVFVSGMDTKTLWFQEVPERDVQARRSLRPQGRSSSAADFL